MSAVEAAAARLTGRVDNWTIYEHGVPDGPLPGRYVLVTGSGGDESASTMADLRDMRDPVVWVTSVCRFADGQFAAREVNESSARVRDALRDWRPDLGRANWKCTHTGLSRPGARDESLPETTYSAVEGFVLRHQV